MKILVVSNLFPPHHIGGYELGCADVVAGLRARGHEVLVLTSFYGLPGPRREPGIERVLEVDFGWDFAHPASGLRLFRKEARNRRAMRRALARFQPDLVYIWSLRSCSVALAMLAEQRGLPTAYYASDTWFAEWQQRDRWFQQPTSPARRRIKQILDKIVNRSGAAVQPKLALDHVQSTSGYIAQVLHESGAHGTTVIHWGVDASRIRARPEGGSATRLLYAGQLVAHKGVETAIAALHHLPESVTLAIAGSGVPAEQRRLAALAAPLDQRVRFLGSLPREELNQRYADFDMLLVPSLWPEPFSITLVEGMIAGLAVVASETGGTPEAIQHGKHGMLFPAGDTVACAHAVQELIDDPARFHRLRLAGQQHALAQFQLDPMCDTIAADLQRVYDANKS